MASTDFPKTPLAALHPQKTWAGPHAASLFGKTIFVDSGHANAGATGTYPERGSYDYPCSTIDYAIGLCTANNGDVIHVAPGHVETISGAAGLVCDVAGVTIIGHGKGAARPNIKFTATASTMTITAASVSIENVLFTGNIDAVVAPITISGADCTLKNFESRDVTGQMTSFITTTAAANRLLIDGWVHNGATAAGGATAISIVGGDGIVIKNFRIFGNFSTAAIENVTTAATNLAIYGDTPCFIQNGLDTNTVDGIAAIALVSTTTGFVGPNINIRIGVDSTSNVANITGAVVGAAMQFMQPINICNLGGEVAMQTNITATTDA